MQQLPPNNPPHSSAPMTPDPAYIARASHIQLTNSQINTLKWKLHVQLTSKIPSHASSPEQLSDNDFHDILTQLHLSLALNYSKALTDAGFGIPSQQARQKIEALRTFLGINGIHLMKMNLSGAILHDANLRGMFLSRTDMSRSDLTGADLSGAYLNWTTLCGAILRNAILRNVVLYGANLRGVILDQTIITLQLPENWEPDQLDLQLNHLTNGRSLLTAINSIDDCYPEYKINLMHQIIDSLEAQNTDTATVNDALLAVWRSNSIYTDDEKIASFINRKCIPVEDV